MPSSSQDWRAAKARRNFWIARRSINQMSESEQPQAAAISARVRSRPCD